MDVTITICTTCKFAPGQAVDAAGGTGGERLAEAVERENLARGAPVRIVRHACLWACVNSCAVLIAAPGRTGYLAGRFTPDDGAAAALLDWARAYGESETGDVRYALWPQGMKGHFIARIPAG